MSYNLFQYGGMIGPQNQVRVAAFEAALKEEVDETSVVLEIGAGTGHFAMLAAKYGAAHVFAVEVNPIVDLAKGLAEDNGYADRITFFHGSSLDIELPQKADVIISDLGGVLAPANANVPILIDARQRHLAPGGKMIPQQTSLWAGVVSAPDLYSRIAEVWEDESKGFDLSRARTQAVNSPRKCQLHREHLTSNPERFCELDYSNVTQANALANLTLVADRSEVAHGLALWTKYQVAPGISISSGPSEPTLPIYGQFFLPWTNPVELEKGDLIEVALKAIHKSNHYIWSWHSSVSSSGGETKASFRQANLPNLLS
ncbi:MAG: class I SAM-dependent methyltransferase [Verrucomicrobiota bacterium]